MKNIENDQLTEEFDREIDIWLLRDNLNSSYEERIARHQNTIDTIEALKQIGLLNRAKSSASS